MDIRCVVTGRDKSGKSVIVRHTPVKPVSVALLPGYEFHRLWGSDSAPELPSDGTPPPQPSYFPPTNGFRFAFFSLPPATTKRSEALDSASALEEIQLKLPGILDVLERDHPGMHTTDTVDFDVIVSGEVTLELDDGAEVHHAPHRLHFPRRGAACCARPRNASENVAHLPRRKMIRHSPRSAALADAHDVNKTTSKTKTREPSLRKSRSQTRASNELH